jgi:hypothetical protein
MTVRISAIVILLCSLGSCKKDQDNAFQVIDTNADMITPTKLSEVFIKTNQINLESTTPLINYIDRVFKTKDYIFVCDGAIEQSRILQFDCKGRFIKQIGSNGHGPGEYIHGADFTIDTSKNNVFVSADNKILCYDFDGRFIRSINTNIGKDWTSSIKFMTFIEEQLWSFEDKTIPADNKSFKWKYIGILIRYNEQLQVVDTTTILEAYYKLDLFGGTGGYILSNLKEKRYVYYPIGPPEPFLRDTLFEFRDFKKIPVLKFDFTDVLVVNENTAINNTSSLPDILETAHKIRNITIDNICRTSRFVFVNYFNDKYKRFLFCYDIEQDKGYNMSEGFTDDLFGTGLTVSLMPLDLKNGGFCFVKEGFEVEGIVDGIGEDSNPVIFYVRTKE